jgi:hypothetical protein
MQEQFMDELRTTHLGAAPPPGPSVAAWLDAAHRELAGAG